MGLLGTFHNHVTVATGAAENSRRFSEDAAGQYDVSTDTAIDLLAAAGLSPTDKDTLGSDIEDTVQTLLTLAFHLAPQLAVHVQIMLEDIQ